MWPLKLAGNFFLNLQALVLNSHIAGDGGDGAGQNTRTTTTNLYWFKPQAGMSTFGADEP